VAEYRNNQPMVYWFVVDTNFWSWWENPTFFCASSLGPIVQICVVNPSWVESRTGILYLEETVLVFFSPGFCFKSVLLRRRLWSHFKTLDAGEAMLLVHIWSWFSSKKLESIFLTIRTKACPNASSEVSQWWVNLVLIQVLSTQRKNRLSFNWVGERLGKRHKHPMHGNIP
jgi:hypothetical protein